MPGSGLDDLPLEAPPLPDASDHTPARFKSLRDEIKKAEGQAVGLSIDPTKTKATVIEVNTDIDTVTLEYLSGHQDVIEYNELINIINALEDDGDGIWTFKGILGHRKKGSKWEVLVDWDHLNSTWEPLSEIKLADAISLAKYAHDNELLNEVGWKWAKKKTQNPKKFLRMVKVYKSQVKD